MNILKWLNPTTWVEGVLMGKVMQKFVKHAVGVIIGLLSGPWFAKVVAPFLSQIGVSIDFDKLAVFLTVFLTGLFGALINWIKHRAKVPTK